MLRRARAGAAAARSCPPIAARRSSGRIELSRPRPTTTRSCRSSATATRTARRIPARTLPRRFRHPEDAADQIARARARHASAVRPAARRACGPPRARCPRPRCVELARAPACAGRPPTRACWSAASSGPLRARQPGRARPAGPALPCPGCAAPRRATCAMLFRDRTLSRPHRLHLLGLDAGGRRGRPARAPPRASASAGRAARLPGDPLVPIILDGENAWEHFRDGGRVFLRALYRGLQADPAPRGGDHDARRWRPAPARELPRVFAGSWIHADFSVWIGHADDRRAWDALGDARDALASAPRRPCPPARSTARWEAYRAAAGSDWCWWYGDDRSSDERLEFDRLFRRHLEVVYRCARPRAAPGSAARRSSPRARRASGIARRAGRSRPRSTARSRPRTSGRRRDAPRAARRVDGAAAAQGIRAVRFGSGRRAPAPARGDERGPGATSLLARREVRGDLPRAPRSAALSSDGRRDARDARSARAPDARWAGARTRRAARGRRGRRCWRSRSRGRAGRGPGAPAARSGVALCRRAPSWSGIRRRAHQSQRPRWRRATVAERHRVHPEGERGSSRRRRSSQRQAHIKSLDEYRALYRRSVDDPEGFWAEQAETLALVASRGTACSSGRRPSRKWFVGGTLNLSENCLDRHVATWRRNKAALIWEGEPGEVAHAHLPAAAARGLPLRERAQGAGRGDGRPRRHLHAA